MLCLRFTCCIVFIPVNPLLLQHRFFDFAQNDTHPGVFIFIDKEAGDVIRKLVEKATVLDSLLRGNVGRVGVSSTDSSTLLRMTGVPPASKSGMTGEQE